MNQKGFTLLELLLSLVILATLTALSMRSIQQALFSKTKIQTQLDEMSQVRDALKVIERDVNLAFHYRDLEIEFRNAVKTAASPPRVTGAPGVPGQFAAGTPPTPEEQLRQTNRLNPVTEFIGQAEQINFVTLNAARANAEQDQADFVEVGYSVKPCRRLSGKEAPSQCLMRRQDLDADSDVSEGGEETVLLENVSEFKLRYFGKGKQDWVDSWSTKDGDAVTKGNFPSAVEISLAVENSEDARIRKISMQIVAQVRFTNNPEPNRRASSEGGNR